MKNENRAEFTLSVNFPLGNAEQLRELLSQVLKARYAELWLDKASAEGCNRALAIYKNSDKAFLMFLDHERGTCFHSLNPDYTGPPDVMLDVYMKNGQGTEMPLSEWVSVDQARQAAEHFYLFGERAPWLTWREDP